LILISIGGKLAAQGEMPGDTVPYIIGYYIIKKPEVVTDVAFRLKVDPVIIVKLNKLRNVNQLLVQDQRIKIPEYPRGYSYQPPVKIPTAAAKDEQAAPAKAMAVEQTSTGRLVYANNQKDDERELDSIRYEQTGLVYQEIKTKELEIAAQITAIERSTAADNDQSTQATLKRMENAKKVAALAAERDSLSAIVAPIEAQVKDLSEKLEKPVPVVQAPVVQADPVAVAPAKTKEDKRKDREKEKEKETKAKDDKPAIDSAAVAINTPASTNNKNEKADVKPDSKVVVTEAPAEKGKKGKKDKDAAKDAKPDTIAVAIVPIVAKADTPKPAKPVVAVVDTPVRIVIGGTPEPAMVKADTAVAVKPASKKTLNEDNNALKRPGKAPKDTVAVAQIKPVPAKPDTVLVLDSKTKPTVTKNKRVPKDASNTQANVKVATTKDTVLLASNTPKTETVKPQPATPVLTAKNDKPLATDTATIPAKNNKGNKPATAAKDTVAKPQPIATQVFKDTVSVAKNNKNDKRNKNEVAAKDTVTKVQPTTATVIVKDTVATARNNKNDKKNKNEVAAKDTVTKIQPTTATVVVKDTIATAKNNKTDKRNKNEVAAKDTVTKVPQPTATVVVKDTISTAKNNKNDKKNKNEVAAKDTVAKVQQPTATVVVKDTIATAKNNKADKNNKNTVAAKDTVSKVQQPTATVVVKDTVATAKNNKADKNNKNAIVAKDTVTKIQQPVASAVVKPATQPTNNVTPPQPAVGRSVANDTVTIKPAKAAKAVEPATTVIFKDTVTIVRTEVPKPTKKEEKNLAAQKDSLDKLKIKSVVTEGNTAKADTARYNTKPVTVSYPPNVDSVPLIKAAFFLERAKRAIEERDLPQAEGHIKKALTLNPNYAEGYNLQGDIYTSGNKMDKAIQSYVKSTTLDSTNAKVYYNLAQLYAHTNKQKDGITAFNKALSLDNKYVMAYMGRAALLNDMKDYKASIADYDKVVELNRFFTYAYKARGMTKFNNDDYTGAIADFDHYLEMEDQDALVYYQRGLAKVKSKQLLQGCMDFDSAFRLGYKEADKAIKKYCE
jgi:tetratricopeptide (TPR) repeat protein